MMGNMAPRCGTCRFFTGDKRGGECHRNPPTMVMAPQRTPLGQIDLVPSAAFPPVTAATWCGEHECAPQFLPEGIEIPADAKPGNIVWMK